MSQLRNYLLRTQKNATLNENFHEKTSGISRTNNQYASNYKKIHDIVFSTNSKIDDGMYKLPNVVAIGEQTSGKSQTIEHYVGASLCPHNSTRSTMQPVKYHVINDSTLNDGERKYTYNGVPIEENQIKLKIQQSFNEKHGVISTEEINIECIASNFVDMCIHDLPGITYHNDDKTAEDITKTYIENKDSINLVMIPCTVPDPSACAILGLIKRLGLTKQTIVVFTMCDDMPHDNILPYFTNFIMKKADDDISNTNFNAHDFLGFAMVINKGTSNRNFIENEIFEREFFKENVLSMFDGIPDDISNEEVEREREELETHLGMSALINILNDSYKKHVLEKWIPKTLEHVNKNIKINELKIETLGADPRTINKNSIYEYYKDNVVIDLIEQIDDNANNTHIYGTNNIPYGELNSYFIDLNNVINNVEIDFTKSWIYDREKCIKNVFDDLQLVDYDAIIQFMTDTPLKSIHSDFSPNRFEKNNKLIKKKLHSIYTTKMIDFIHIHKGEIHTTIMRGDIESDTHDKYNYSELHKQCMKEIMCMYVRHFDALFGDCFYIIEESEEYTQDRLKYNTELVKYIGASTDLLDLEIQIRETNDEQDYIEEVNDEEADVEKLPDIDKEADVEELSNINTETNVGELPNIDKDEEETKETEETKKSVNDNNNNAEKPYKVIKKNSKTVKVVQ